MKYDPALDGLRGASALSVLLFHFGVLYGGAEGVDIFFVLSGYLITNMLTADIERFGSPRLSVFYKRRARRLLPALLLLLALYAAASQSSTKWEDIALSASYTMNWHEALWRDSNPLSHTWSLAIEAQFYLIWPFIMMTLLRFGKRSAALVVLLTWALISAARFEWMKLGHSPDVAYFGNPLHATGLLIGSALALYPVRIAYASVPAILLLVVIGLFTTTDEIGWTVILIELSAAALITAPPRALAWPPLVMLGTISYGFYLLHVPILIGLKWLNAPMTLTTLIIFFGLTTVAAALSYVFIERRFIESQGRVHWLAGNLTSSRNEPPQPVR